MGCIFLIKMAIIIPNYSSSKIIMPSSSDYARLGIEAPKGDLLRLATPAETKELTGVDVSYGISLEKVGFFGNRPSHLFAPSDDDSNRLGIRTDFFVDKNGTPVPGKSYSIKEGVAYVQDSSRSLVETLARDLASVVKKEGVVNLVFTIPGFPFSGLGLHDPNVENLKAAHGTRTVNNLFPKYLGLRKQIPPGFSSGRTRKGLEFTLY
jgi:hypothetical protein